MDSITKPRSSAGRFNLFFMEMIIVLLFFSVASAIILRSFAAADRLARDSRRLENMSFCARSAAELYSASGSMSQTAEMLFDTDISEENVSEMTLPLSEDCRYSPADAEIFVTLTETDEGGVLKILRIKFADKDGGTLYEIETGYIPEKPEKEGRQ